MSSGGIAVIFPSGKIEWLFLNEATEGDVYDCLNVIYWEEEVGRAKVFAVIEWIHPAIQGVGKASMSKLYGSFMSLRMALTGCHIPYRIVNPIKWQPEFTTRRGKSEKVNHWKDRLRGVAQNLFPKCELWKLGLGKQRQICDALLLAEYARRTC